VLDASHGPTPEISIISPVYRAAVIVPRLVERIIAAIETIGVSYEIILIDDRSPDDSWPAIVAETAKSPHVRGVRLSRNFGQHNAISAGLALSRGQYVVVMDCDLQDNPDYIPQMYREIQTGYDIVLTRKIAKNHNAWRRLTAWAFFAIYNWAVDNKLPRNIGGYSMISRKVVAAFLSLGDYHRHYSLILNWLGFRRTIIDVVHDARFEGASSYSLRKLINIAFDAIVVHSQKLLRLSLTAAALFLLGAAMMMSYVIVQWFRGIAYLTGWPSTAVLILFCSSVILAMIGVLGVYLGRIYEQVRQRPLFVVDEIVPSPIDAAESKDGDRPVFGFAATKPSEIAKDVRSID